MDFWDFLIQPYKEVLPLHIYLEGAAIAASLISVFYSFKNKVLVFPFGILSTLFYMYLLLEWNLLGDMIINCYYFIMSIYGWYLWTAPSNGLPRRPIKRTQKTEWKIASSIIISAMAAVFAVYYFSKRLEPWVSFVDMLTTGIFFAGMWLMARRKLEHWLVLLLGNLISVPLYLYKGYALTAILYIFLTIIAYFGYVAWKKHLNNAHQVA